MPRAAEARQAGRAYPYPYPYSLSQTFTYPYPNPTPNPTPNPSPPPTVTLNVCAQQAIAALHRDDHEGAARALSAARAGALALLGTELLEQPSLRQQGR